MAKKKAATPPGKFPKTLGACIDRLRELELEAQALDAQAKLAWDAYGVLEVHLIETSSKNELAAAKGTLATVEIGNHEYPAVEDWNKFYSALLFGALDARQVGKLLKVTIAPSTWQKLKQLVVDEATWELLQKRVGVEAWRERLKNKIVVPGTKVFNKTKLKLKPIKPLRRK